MKLYDGRNKIIKLFEKNNTVPSDFPYNAKTDKLEESEQELEQESERELIETIKERTKKGDEKICLI